MRCMHAHLILSTPPCSTGLPSLKVDSSIGEFLLHVNRVNLKKPFEHPTCIYMRFDGLQMFWVLKATPNLGNLLMKLSNSWYTFQTIYCECSFRSSFLYYSDKCMNNHSLINSIRRSVSCLFNILCKKFYARTVASFHSYLC